MARGTLSVILLFTTLLFSGCYNSGPCESGIGDVIVQEVIVNDFNRINVEIAGDVFITQAAEQKVTVESNGNIISRLETIVDDGEWRIRFRSCVNNYDRLNIYIETPDMEGIVLSGAGNITTNSTFESPNANVALIGSGNITASFDVVNMSTVLSGSGNILLSGTCNAHNASLPGSGNIGSFDLQSETANVEISGSGSADVSVSQTLNVTISGSGNVRYMGDPSVTQNITGSGSVIKVN